MALSPNAPFSLCSQSQCLPTNLIAWAVSSLYRSLMLSLLGSDSPFDPPNHSTQFVALGYLLGKFERLPEEGQSETRSVRGWLRLETGTKLKTVIPRQFWRRFIKDPEFDQDKPYLWRLYPRTTEAGKLVSLQLIKFISVEEQIRSGSPSVAKLGANYFLIRGVVDKQILEYSTVKILVRRNPDPPQEKANTFLWKPFVLTLQGKLLNAKTGQFWEILCTREVEKMAIAEAKMIAEAVDIQPETNNFTTSPSLAKNNTVMIKGRKAEITIKFVERPTLPEQGEKVKLQVIGENGIIVKTEVNRKTLKKQVEKMDSLTEWIGALSGKITGIAPDSTIELEEATIYVFEKKSKAAPEDEQSSSTKTDTSTEANQKEQEKARTK